MLFLFGAGVLGHRLGSFGNCVLGQFTGEKQTNRGLDLAGRDGASFVVLSQTGSLSTDALEDVVHERVHDGHCLGADPGVGMDLLEDLVDVAAVGFLALLFAFLVARASGGFFASFLGGLCRDFGRHGKNQARSKSVEKNFGKKFLFRIIKLTTNVDMMRKLSRSLIG